MSAVESRLAAIIAEQMRTDGWTCEYHEPTSREGECSGCDESLARTARAAAAVIASVADLAVVALEAPRRRRDSYSRPIKGWLPWKRGVVHIAPEGMVPREGRYEGAYLVRYDDQRGGGTIYTPKSAGEFAAALLAAAKAAEGVSRDGE